MQIAGLFKKQQQPRPADHQSDAPPTAPDDCEPMKRLTLDVPESLHRRIKAQCAGAGVTMVEAIVDLLEQRFR